MSKQKLKLKTKTIDQIVPKWSKLFDLYTKEGTSDKVKKYRNRHHLSIADSQRCVVGEAHGFDDKYGGCDTCHDFSHLKPNGDDFITLETRFDTNFEPSNWREEIVVKEFVAHWNKEHLK